MIRKVACRPLVGNLGPEVNLGGLGQANARDRLAVVRSAVHDQCVSMVRHAGVRVHTALIGRRAGVFKRIRNLARIAHAARARHVAQRAD